MSRCVLAIALCLLYSSEAFAQAQISVEGVWKITEIVTPGGKPLPDGVTVTSSNPQPGIIIFTKGYYSEVRIRGDQPRPTVPRAKDPQNLTDAEKLARFEQWRLFAASVCTYEIKNSMLIRRVIVAKNVNMMTSEPPILEVKAEGANTLWLIPIGAWAATEPRFKLTRLE